MQSPVVIIIVVVVMVLNPPPPFPCPNFPSVRWRHVPRRRAWQSICSFNCHGIAEPELLLGGVSGVCTRTADVDGLLLVFLATAPPLRVCFPLLRGLQ